MKKKMEKGSEDHVSLVAYLDSQLSEYTSFEVLYL